MVLFDLEVHFLVEGYRDKGPTRFCHWVNYCGHNAAYNYRKPSMLLYSKEDINKALKDKHADVNQVTKLYFDPESSYPRFKIKDTKFSRVIKVDNSDAVVLPNDISFAETRYSYKVYKGSTNVYVLSEDAFMAADKTIYNKIIEYGDNFENALRTLNVLPKEATLVYSGKICYCEEHFYQTIFNILNTYKKYVTEEDVDTIVNKSMEKLTEETAISINGMLASTDPAVVELGLKILQGIDVLNTPLTVKLLLIGNYPNISKNKAMNTTGVTQIFRTLKLPIWSISSYPGSLGLIFKKDSWDAASEEDKKLTLSIGKEIVSAYFLAEWNDLRKAVPGLPFNVKTYVE